MKKVFVIALISFLALSGMVVYQYLSFRDGKLHVIFCDVGQGDAIFIRTPDNKYILVDAGPDNRALDCLTRHMPFWERTLDLVLLTHPHTDHFYGLYHVIDRYNILHFGTENLRNKAASFQELERRLAKKQITKKIVYAGDKWKIGQVTVTIAAPTKSFLEQTSPGGFIGEGKEFANLITHLSYGSFDVLLTGDSQASELLKAGMKIVQQIDVLQVPHHGSATGLTVEALRQINPHITVISVGAKNRYGHPKPQILNLLKAQGIQAFRTDRQGDVEIVSDGKVWKVY